MRSQLKDYFPDYLYLLSIAGPIIFFDQLTKIIVRQNVPFRDTWMPLDWLAPYVRIVNWHNTGAAFGMFQGGGWIFGILAIIVSIAILVYYPVVPRTDKWMRIALSLQLAGALGNLIDRITVGAVTDFVSIWTFPVFNVADASITLGTAVLIIPYLPHFRTELAVNQVLQRARQINLRRRIVPSNPEAKAIKEDDSYTLGILEVLLQDTSPVREFILTQRARRIRHQYNHHRSTAPGKERQPRPPQ